jgi:hypothetical protein
MNEPEKNKSSCCGSGCEFNMGMLKGLIALIVGVIFILMAYKIIAHLVLFFAGVALVYYGLTVLKIEKVQTYSCAIAEKIKKFWNS